MGKQREAHNIPRIPARSTWTETIRLCYPRDPRSAEIWYSGTYAVFYQMDVQMLYSIKYCVQAGIGWYRLDLPSVGPRGLQLYAVQAHCNLKMGKLVSVQISAVQFLDQ
jgi:hypothetical protein